MCFLNLQSFLVLRLKSFQLSAFFINYSAKTLDFSKTEKSKTVSPFFEAVSLYTSQYNNCHFSTSMTLLTPVPFPQNCCPATTVPGFVFVKLFVEQLCIFYRSLLTATLLFQLWTTFKVLFSDHLISISSRLDRYCTAQPEIILSRLYTRLLRFNFKICNS